MTDYYGKYRGKVENNVDPQRLGRIQVSCPSVLGDGPISWARPSARTFVAPLVHCAVAQGGCIAQPLTVYCVVCTTIG